MTPAEIITVILAALGSGGIATLVTAWASRKKTNAEAGATNIKSILEIDARLNERISKLEERVGKLEEENLQLRQNELQLRHENEMYKEENEELKREIEQLRAENARLVEENDQLKKILSKSISKEPE